MGPEGVAVGDVCGLPGVSQSCPVPCIPHQMCSRTQRGVEVICTWSVWGSAKRKNLDLDSKNAQSVCLLSTYCVPCLCWDRPHGGNSLRDQDGPCFYTVCIPARKTDCKEANSALGKCRELVQLGLVWAERRLEQRIGRDASVQVRPPATLA